MRLTVLLLAALTAVLPSGAPRAAGSGEAAAVTALNASRPTRCAEEDNVDIRLQGAGIAALRITAGPPPYLPALVTDSTAPDFRHCDMSSDPRHAFVPKTVTLHDERGIALIAHTFAQFWRPERVPVTVGDRTEADVHLLQVFRTDVGQPIEILVLYPADGYWRAKPLPPPHLPETAYGSSFLIGPVEIDGRPLVRLRDVAFDPATLSFGLRFARGGGATLRIVAADAGATALAVRFNPPLGAALPFAALRSMYVADDLADVAEATWRAAVDAPWRTAPILAFPGGAVEAISFGRRLPSRHNTSAPDLRFDGFEAAR